MKTFFCYLFYVLLFISSTTKVQAQNDSITRVEKLRKLISDNSIKEAKLELNRQIAYFKTAKQPDSLLKYYEFVNSFKLVNNNRDAAIKNSEDFTDYLMQFSNPYVSFKALVGLAEVNRDAGHVEKAYDIFKSAIPYVEKLTKNRTKELADLEYSLGHCALQMSNYPLSKKHHLRGLIALKKSKTPDYVSFQQAYNSIGIVYWSESNMDSTSYYLKKSLEALNNAPKGNDFMNAYYRPALLEGNLAIVSQALGKNYEAIEFTERAIKNYQNFLNHSKDEQRKLRARKSQLATIDNLGAFYSEIGEFQRAEDLIQYSYTIKKRLLEKEDINITISKIILAQAKINTQDLENAATLLDEAINELEKKENEQSYWKAVAYITRASVYRDLKNYKNAKLYYEKGEALNRASTNNTFSKEFLEEIGTMAIFNAKHGDPKKALTLANEAYVFTTNSSFSNTLPEFNSIVKLSEVHFILKNYEEAKRYSDSAIHFNFQTNSSKSISDSIALQFNKPKAIVINVKSKYALETNKSEVFLKQLLVQIEEGISILDQRKTTIKSHNDLTTLISQNKALFDEAKNLRLKLFEKTGDKTYLMDALTLHESGLYNRIRSRLNLRENIVFSNIPHSVIDREQQLKKAINSSLESNETIDSFFEANANWNTFLDSLKRNYSKYYKMRYAKIETPLNNLQEKLSEQTTVIRYMFVDHMLYAFVIDKSSSAIFKLDNTDLSKTIQNLADNQSEFDITSSSLFSLYKQLWKPFEDKINTKHLVVIPDGELFNLSFESLTPNKISNFSEMKTQSLLSKYSISYNYSLLLLNTTESETFYSKNFIGFAPEFNTKMKSEYQLTIQDSVGVDKTYLTLLPQPFTKDLAQYSSKIFKGTSFINENASKQIFTEQAKEHKIIHIGTHAESNNISPELSRLIFAKNVNDSITSEDNSLYTYEIYNQNLSSNLAILTACETGKPTYQAGEGMISLAHAFNYAGSESILTSLWKIDEQSSAKIIEYFYTYLKKGLPKDQALQEAKLDYISTAEGRTIAPQYWAGLVIIGDTTPIELKTSSNLVFWLFGIVLIIVFSFILKKRRIKRRSK